MNINAPSHLSQWWAYASNASNGARLAIARNLTSLIQFGATWEAGVAAIATRLFRAVGSLVPHLGSWASDETRTAPGLLALARSLNARSPVLPRNCASSLRIDPMPPSEAAGCVEVRRRAAGSDAGRIALRRQ